MPEINISVKGPSDLKLSLRVDTSVTVEELKQQIATENSEFPADQQRLIYSGRVLKDNECVEKYGLKEGHTIHLVSLCDDEDPFEHHRNRATMCRTWHLKYCELVTEIEHADPDLASCKPLQVKGAKPAGPSGVPGTTEAAGVPRNFAAGQQVAGNPLAPLMNAQNAGALGVYIRTKSPQPR